jgi:hypothetical protein
MTTYNSTGMEHIHQRNQFFASLDMEIPGSGIFRAATARERATSGKISERAFDAPVSNILKFIKKSSSVPVKREEGKRNFPGEQALNKQLPENV